MILPEKSAFDQYVPVPMQYSVLPVMPYCSGRTHSFSPLSMYVNGETARRRMVSYIPAAANCQWPISFGKSLLTVSAAALYGWYSVQLFSLLLHSILMLSNEYVWRTWRLFGFGGMQSV